MSVDSSRKPLKAGPVLHEIPILAGEILGNLLLTCPLFLLLQVSPFFRICLFPFCLSPVFASDENWFFVFHSN
jgi:hypothetical protein